MSDQDNKDEKPQIELPLSQDFLDELSDVMMPAHLYYLQEKIVGSNRGKIRDEIEKQIPETMEILSDMTEYEYFEQQIELEDFPALTLRSIPSWAPEEASDFARKKTETDKNYNRVYARRRLAYALVKIGDKSVGPSPLDGSYADMRLNIGSDELRKKLVDQADDRYEELAAKPDLLTSRISDIFGAWDLVLFDRINNVEYETVKN